MLILCFSVGLQLLNTHSYERDQRRGNAFNKMHHFEEKEQYCSRDKYMLYNCVLCNHNPLFIIQKLSGTFHCFAQKPQNMIVYISTYSYSHSNLNPKPMSHFASWKDQQRLKSHAEMSSLPADTKTCPHNDRNTRTHAPGRQSLMTQHWPYVSSKHPPSVFNASSLHQTSNVHTRASHKECCDAMVPPGTVKEQHLTELNENSLAWAE